MGHGRAHAREALLLRARHGDRIRPRRSAHGHGVDERRSERPPRPSRARRTVGAPRRGGWPPLRRGPEPGSPPRPRGRTGWSGTRVWAYTRAHGVPPPRPSDEAPRPRRAVRVSPRSLTAAGRAGASRCRGTRPRAARRTRCKTASVPTRTGASGTGSFGPPRPDRSPRPRRSRAMPPAPRGSRLTPRAASSCEAARRRADHGPRLTAAWAVQTVLAPRVPHRRTASVAAGQLPAVPAGQEPGPAGPVVHAHQRSRVGPLPSSRTARARRTNSSENMPVRGSAPRRSTCSRTGQPARSSGRRDSDTWAFR